MHDDERRGLHRGQGLGDLGRQQEAREALAELLEVGDRHARHEARVLALEQAQVEPAAGDERRRLRRGAKERDAQLRRRFLHEEPGERRRRLLQRARRLARELALARDPHERRRGMQPQQVFGHPARGAKALGVARNDRDALQALLGREIGERGQHALELRARGIRGLGAGGRAPEHHREVLDAREREGARHVGGGEALHVRTVAAEVAETREDDEPRREAAAADRQHEDLSGGGADRAPPREVADRAVQHLVDRLRGARGLHVREGAEHDRGAVALRDAALA